MATTYTVKKDDTLYAIAREFASSIEGNTLAARVQTLVKLNNIKDPDYIVVGQVLKLSGSASGSSKNNSSKPVIDVFGLQSNTERTVYATWTWSKDHTDKYQVMWYYDTGDNVWFIGSNTTVEDNQSTYNAPENAKKVKFKVKAISETYESNNKQVSYWTGGWSTEKTYNFSDNPPSKPPTPDVKIEKYKLTATLDNLDVNGTRINFEVVKNNLSVFKFGYANIITGHASFSCNIDPGAEYKVRARAERGSLYSDWSEYSANESTIPSAPSSITSLKALSSTSIQVKWGSVANAESYDVEYTTKKTYFDSSGEVKSQSVTTTHAEITGLTSGEEYFFRVRANNKQGDSGWTGIKSLVIGKTPAAPTTWSSTTTAVIGESLTLYWVHNSEDASSQTYAELELYVNDLKTVHTIQNSTEEDEKDKTSFYAIDTTDYAEGASIQWRVRTAGITKVYGDWSAQRTVDIYAPPTLQLMATDSSGSAFETLTSLPFKVRGVAGPNTQSPIGYQLSIIANSAYETINDIGVTKLVGAGEEVYSQYFDTFQALEAEISASNIDLENNVEYTIVCVVAMNSGLTAESRLPFKVAWTDVQYEPDAQIAIDTNEYTASINPYCVDENGNLIEDILLSVYRREFDGGFTELISDIENTDNTFITDPHPALDFARYRIVAKSKTTGAISYYDLPGYPVGCKAAIIQWDETWSDFNSVAEGDTVVADGQGTLTWAGSMLKLMYNIDISENSDPDKALVNYIGRKHSVSYYGTHVGSTSNWSMEIDKNDDETIYQLRRLQNWMGDVYVRSPSGIGFWASINVSFGEKHRELTIPVSIDVTRVEGGI